MWDFKLGEVFATLWKTKSFLVFRFLIYMGITLAYIVGTGTGGGVGYLFGAVAANKPAGVFYGMVGGFTLVSGVLFYLREYLLYMVKAGHIAVIVKVLDGEDIPEGKGQIRYAQEIVKQRFKEASILFVLDQIIKKVLKAFNRAFFAIASWLPIPDGVLRFINAVVNTSITYVDEVMLAYNIRHEVENPWEGSRTALVLYAQNYKIFLKNALFLTAITWILSVLVLVFTFGPIAALIAYTPYQGGVAPFVLALVTAWGVKSALIDPLAMTAMMQVFFKVTEGQQPNPEWDAKLERASDKFVELKDRAVAWGKERFGSDSQETAVPKP